MLPLGMSATNKLYYDSEKSCQIETCLTLTQSFPNTFDRKPRKFFLKNVLIPQTGALRNVLREMPT